MPKAAGTLTLVGVAKVPILFPERGIGQEPEGKSAVNVPPSTFGDFFFKKKVAVQPCILGTIFSLAPVGPGREFLQEILGGHIWT